MLQSKQHEVCTEPWKAQLCSLLLSLSLSNPSPHFEQTQPSKTTVSISHLLRLLETQMVPMMSGLPFSAWLVWIPHSLVPQTFSRLCPCRLCPHGASAQSHTLPSCPLSKAVFAASSWNYHCILRPCFLVGVQSWINSGFSLPLKSSQDCLLHQTSEYIFPPHWHPGESAPTQLSASLLEDSVYRNLYC